MPTFSVTTITDMTITTNISSPPLITIDVTVITTISSPLITIESRPQYHHRHRVHQHQGHHRHDRHTVTGRHV
ncbi:Hypothetical predicted protein [Marmota monax]|uniref:Uncharacterized protein n=1 Tax=Marmota monax TaxID=9995 RepID=A0A5E4CFY0_MARMO|nr:Hypothetical predicted protein [Marmota monax]